MGEAIQKQSDAEYDGRPLQHVHQQFAAVIAAFDPPRKRKRNRDTGDPQKERKHEIGECPAVPVSVLQLRIRLIGRLVVHHDHGGYRAAAKHVQGL